MSVDLTGSETNINTENRENRWELLPQIQKGLEELLEQNNQNAEIKNLLKKLEKMIELKNKINLQESNLKLGKLIVLRERNVYLGKLRKIEEYADEENWQDPDGYLEDLREILFRD